MASIINATTTNGLAVTPDNSGELRLQTNNGTTAVTIDTSQNVGIGVAPSAWSTTVPALQLGGGGAFLAGLGSSPYVALGTNAHYNGSNFVYRTTNTASYYDQSSGLHRWYTAPSGTAGTNVTFTQAMILDASGNLGIGTTTPSALLHARGQNVLSASTRYLKTWVGGAGSWGASSYEELGIGYSGIRSIYTSGDNWDLTFATGTSTQFAAGTQAERMRITSSGHVLIGTTDTSTESGVGFKYIPSTTGPYTGVVKNTNSNSTEWHLYNTNATNNGYRFYVGANGGIYNYSANNINLSDERTKENIELAGNYLDKICSIPVKTFNYKDEPTGEQKTLGVIAQDVELIAPEFVNNDGWKGNDPEDGVPLKTIYTTDMMFGLMKAIQELKTELDTVKAELNTLKNPPVEGTE
jgi:hypothetical protein